MQARRGGREEEEVASTISKGSGRACYDAEREPESERGEEKERGGRLNVDVIR